MKLKFLLVFLLVPLMFLVVGCEKKTADNGNIDQEEIFNSSPSEMIKLGKSLHCTFSYNLEGEMASAGEFYLDGKNERFRSETMVKDVQSKVEMQSTMIFDKNLMYSWSATPGYPAIKMTVQMENQAGSDIQETEQLDWDQNAQYKCKKWNVDDSLFTPPANIDFIDFDQMMNSFNIPTY